MPGVPGTRVLTEVKRLQPNLPVLVVTGSMAEPVHLEAAAAVLTKPVLRTDLVRTLAEALGSSNAPSTNGGPAASHTTPSTAPGGPSGPAPSARSAPRLW